MVSVLYDILYKVKLKTLEYVVDPCIDDPHFFEYRSDAKLF